MIASLLQAQRHKPHAGCYTVLQEQRQRNAAKEGSQSLASQSLAPSPCKSRAEAWERRFSGAGGVDRGSEAADAQQRDIYIAWSAGLRCRMAAW